MRERKTAEPPELNKYWICDMVIVVVVVVVNVQCDENSQNKTK